jgi:pyridoxamine 5'-phosphate oxidase family protein
MTLTEPERRYLRTQRIGRLATVGPDGSPQNNPVGFHYNAELGTIDIGGLRLGETRKFRNVRANGRVAFVVDDIASVDPWHVRGIELRGHAEALVDHPPARPYFSPELIRIHPEQVFSWGIDADGHQMRRRDVAAARGPSGAQAGST